MQGNTNRSKNHIVMYKWAGLSCDRLTPSPQTLKLLDRAGCGQTLLCTRNILPVGLAHSSVR